MTTTTSSTASKSIQEWVQEVGIGLSSYWVIPPELRPASVKVGARVLITEPASEWLQRMAQHGGVQTTTKKKAKSAP